MLNLRQNLLILAISLVVAAPCSAAIRVIAPEEEQFVAIKDFFVSFSVHDYDADIRRAKMFFDHEDISRKLRITAHTISFIPDRLFLNRPDIEGPHVVTLILYGPYRERLDEISVKFYLVEDEEISAARRDKMVLSGKDLETARPAEFINTGKVYTAAEYVSYRDSGNFLSELDAYANGYRGNWFYNSYIYLNTEESAREQTLQRFMVSTGYTKNYIASFGDVWPSYNSFILKDKRVRGLELNLKSPKRNANLDFVIGRAHRAIDPYLYSQQALDSAILLHDTTGVGPFGHNDSMLYFEDGTYKRRLLATRLHFGTGRIFKFGIDFLKAKDDTTSMNQIYTAGDSGEIWITGETPKDNIALGLDAQLNLWKRRIILYGDYGFSFLTRNILGGPISAQDFTDSITINMTFEDIHRMLIVNASTIPVPIPATEDEQLNNRSLAKAMVGDIGCRLNIPIGTARELFEFRYFLLGPNFASLGNENLQVNRRGFELSEEVRLLSGKTTLKGSFEYYRDNLNEAKDEPTRSFDLRLLAIFMWDRRFPYATVTFGINDDKAESSDTINTDNHNRLNSAGVSLQYSRTLGIAANTFSLSYANARSTIASDALLNDINLTINTVVLSVNTRYDDSPLESRASVAGNFSRGEYGINLASSLLGGRWHFIPDAMYLDFDIGYDYSRNWGEDAEHELIAKSSLNWDIGNHHTIYATANLNKILGTSYVSPGARASYEFRF